VDLKRRRPCYPANLRLSAGQRGGLRRTSRGEVSGACRSADRQEFGFTRSDAPGFDTQRAVCTRVFRPVCENGADHLLHVHLAANFRLVRALDRLCGSCRRDSGRGGGRAGHATTPHSRAASQLFTCQRLARPAPARLPFDSPGKPQTPSRVIDLPKSAGRDTKRSAPPRSSRAARLSHFFHRPRSRRNAAERNTRYVYGARDRTGHLPPLDAGS